MRQDIFPKLEISSTKKEIRNQKQQEIRNNKQQKTTRNNKKQ